MPLSWWGLDVMSESHCTNPNGGLLIRPKHKKICMSTFESHAIRIGRKASLKGIEFMNTHLVFLSLSTVELCKKCAFFFLPGMISRHALSRNVIHKDCKLGMMLTNW